MSNSQYNVAQQGLGLALVLLGSLLGAGFSFWIAHVKRVGGSELSFTAGLLLLLKGLGTGVAIATALVHLINEAYDYFEDAGWSGEEGQFDAWPMAFAIVGIALMAFGDFCSKRYSQARDCAGEQNSDPAKAADAEALMDVDHGHCHGNNTKLCSEKRKCDSNEGADSREKGANPEALMDVEHGHDRAGDYGPSIAADIVPCGEGANGADSNGASFSSEQGVSLSEKRRAAFIFELSVITHSIFVGFDLGLQNEDKWKTLMIAIIFHQFFEGIAFSQVIAEARYDSLLRSFIVIAIFVCTTPLGVGIGMIVRTVTDDEDSPTGVHLMLAIFNSLCGGVLLYIGLVNLLVPWFIDDKVLLRAGKRFVLLAWGGVFFGLGIMTFIGKYA